MFNNKFNKINIFVNNFIYKFDNISAIYFF